MLFETFSLLGLGCSLVLTAKWVKHVHTALYHAVFLVLKFNSKIVLSSSKFKYLTDLLTSENINIKNFYLAKAHNTAWNSKE